MSNMRVGIDCNWQVRAGSRNLKWGGGGGGGGAKSYTLNQKGVFIENFGRKGGGGGGVRTPCTTTLDPGHTTPPSL